MGKRTRSCPPGQIRRSSYTRKSYRRKTGVKVKKTRVSSKCIKDRGRPGKGKKLFTLKKVSLLRKYGYKLSESKEKRRKALQKAIKEYNHLEILRHLNAIRNITSKVDQMKNYKKLSDDVEYLKKLYKKQKEKKKTKRKSRTRKSRTRKK